MKIGEKKFFKTFGVEKEFACLNWTTVLHKKISKVVKEDLKNMRKIFNNYRFQHIMEDKPTKQTFFRTYWHKIVYARDNFGQDECDMCGVDILWWEDSLDDIPISGRMYNIGYSNEMLRSHWMSLCKTCFYSIRQKEIWEEEIDERRLWRKDLKTLDEIYNIFEGQRKKLSFYI